MELQRAASGKKLKRIILVNREFQLKYAGAAIIVGIVSTMITTFVILYPLYVFKILRISTFVPLPILLVMAAAAVVNIFFIGMMGVFVTHRIAGPVYSIVKFIRQVEEGLWHGKIKLRKGDELGYLVRNLNAMIDSINKTGKSDLEKISSLKTAIEDESIDDNRKKLLIEEGLNELIDQYKARLNCD